VHHVLRAGETRQVTVNDNAVKAVIDERQQIAEQPDE
jgi:hypothetical protein